MRIKIRDILRSGELGKIQYVDYRGSFSGYSLLNSGPRGWEGSREKGGGMLFAVGSHMIDSLLWWMDEPIVEVYGDLDVRVPLYDGPDGIEARNAEDAFALSGHFRSGARFKLDLFYPAVRGRGWELLIYGTKGTLRMTDDRNVEVSFGEVFQPVEIDSNEVPEELAASAIPYYEGLFPLLDAVGRSLAAGKAVPDVPTFADGHRVQRVMDAVFESHKKKAVVRIDSDDKSRPIA